MKATKIDGTGRPIAKQTASAAAETFTFGIQAASRTGGFLVVKYFGSNKEYVGIFPYVIVNTNTPTRSVGAAVIEQAFNGVSCTVSFNGVNIDVAITNGVSGASVFVDYLHV